MTLRCRWVVQKSEKVEDFVMGQYVLGTAQGIRTYPYSTNPYVFFPNSTSLASVDRPRICRTTNPLRYSNLTTLNEVHSIGEVWANMLHNVYATLVEAHGFSTTALTDPRSEKGNVVFMHLMISALPLQPCNPTCTSSFTLTQSKSNPPFPFSFFFGVDFRILSSCFCTRCLDPGRPQLVSRCD